MSNEIELKLRIDASHADTLAQHPVIRQHLRQPPVTHHLISTYYDTPALDLLDKKLSLRVRSMDDQWFQAVKGAGRSLAGLHQRMEWEDIITGDKPDFDKISQISDPEVHAVFADPVLRDALQPIFTTDMIRTEWQLVFEDETHLELALDLGSLVIAGETKERIEEIEIELKSGNAVHVFELGLELQKDIPLTIENISKAQRGYAYYRPGQPKPNTAKAIKIEPGASADKIFGLTVWECVRHLQANQEVVLKELNAEGITQMQLATQRLDTAILQYQKLGAPGNEIRWLNHILSHNTPAQIVDHLKGQRYQRLLLNLGAWLVANTNV